MMHYKVNRKGFTLIELAVVLAIISIIAGIFIRIKYANEIHEWESGIYRWMGFDPELTRFAIGSIVFITFILIAIKKRISRRK